VGSEGDYCVVQQRLPGHVRSPRRQGGRHHGNNTFLTKIWPFLAGLWIRIQHFSYLRIRIQEKLSALKNEHPALQNMKILYFFLYLWVILPSWIRIRIHHLKLMRIRIYNPDF